MADVLLQINARWRVMRQKERIENYGIIIQRYYNRSRFTALRNLSARENRSAPE